MSAFNCRVLSLFTVFCLNSVLTLQEATDNSPTAEVEDYEIYSVIPDETVTLEVANPAECEDGQTCAVQEFESAPGGYIRNDLVTHCLCPEDYICREFRQVDEVRRSTVYHKCSPKLFWIGSERLDNGGELGFRQTKISQFGKWK